MVELPRISSVTLKNPSNQVFEIVNDGRKVAGNRANFVVFIVFAYSAKSSLRWRHNGRDGRLKSPAHDCLLNRLFRRRSKKTTKLRVTGLCVGNTPVTGEFPAQIASNAENVSIWWRHHDMRAQRWTS